MNKEMKVIILVLAVVAGLIIVLEYNKKKGDADKPAPDLKAPTSDLTRTLPPAIDEESFLVTDKDPETAPGRLPAKDPPTSDFAPLAKPAELKPPVPSSWPKDYTVVQGDNLSGIAKRVLGDARQLPDLLEANPELTLDTLLQPGMKLNLPAKGELVKPDVVKVKPVPENGRLYRIKENDTLYSIATRELGSPGKLKEILSLNPGIDADRLKIGDTLRLPQLAQP